MVSVRTLISFAFVCERYGETGDIAQGFMPLFAPIAAKRPGKLFDPIEFSREVNALYGIKMHPYVAEDWQERLEREGLLYSRIKSNNSKEYRYETNIPMPAGGKEKEIKGIITELTNTVKNALDNANLAISADDVEHQVLHRIRLLDFHNITSAPEPSYILPKTLKVDIEKPFEQTDEQRRGKMIDYVCAKYALRLKNDDGEKFQLLCDIAAGALASEVVLDLRVPPTASSRAEGLKAFLDAPLILDLLDIGDEQAFEYAKQIIHDLTEMGAQIFTFENNVREVSSIVAARISTNRDKIYGTGSIGHRLARDQFARVRIQNLKNSVRKVIKEKLHIEIVNFDESHQNLYKYFPEENETDLLARIRPGSNTSLIGRETDARSIANILRLTRHQGPASMVFSPGYIFLTKNDQVAAIGNKSAHENKVISVENSPIFLTDRYLAGLIWLSKGGVGTTIPQQLLVANCTVAISARRDVITKMIATLSGLDEDKAEEFSAFMTDQRCSNYLMDLSLGDPSSITPETAPIILDKLRPKIVADLEEKTQALKTEFDESKKRTEGLEATLEEFVKDHDSLERQVSERTEEVNIYRDKNVKMQSTIDNNNTKIRKLEDEQILAPCIDAGNRWALITLTFFFLFTNTVVYLIGIFAAPNVNETTVVISSVLGTSLLAVLQIFFPSDGFGPWLNQRRQNKYLAKAEQLDVLKTAQSYRIDWKTKRLFNKLN